MAEQEKTSPKDETTQPKAEQSKADDSKDQPEVDPRLDNRSGRHAPDLSADVPLKPQQVHGGYAGDESEFEDPPSGKRTTAYRSEGPHGRGPQAGPSSED